jgi:hypothetical protein
MSNAKKRNLGSINLKNGAGDDSVHNNLDGLQGGTTDEMFHLTSQENDDLAAGATGTFTTVDSKTVTVTNGIITAITP